MYKVRIDYENGTHNEATVPDSKAADALKAEWEAAAPWHDSGYELEQAHG
jgi:hypothetical protein